MRQKAITYFIFLCILLVGCDLSKPIHPYSATDTQSYGSYGFQPTLTPIVGVVKIKALTTASPTFLPTSKDNSHTSSSLPMAITKPSGITSTLTPDALQNSKNLGIEEFVRFYYANINMRNYKLTWSFLTPKFINLANPPSEGGYQGYVDWWNTIDHVNVTEVDIITKDESSATIQVSAIYHYKKGITEKSILHFYLIFDSSRSTWLFD